MKTFIIDAGSELEISEEEKKFLKKKEFIYYCPSCKAYHCDPHAVVSMDSIEKELNNRCK